MQSSAAAFTKGLLDLEGSALTPILVRAPRPLAALNPPLRAPLPCAVPRNRCRPTPTHPLPHPCAPCQVSLVKKDAGMLDAFGKGASEDIRLAKEELYAQASLLSFFLLSFACACLLCLGG